MHGFISQLSILFHWHMGLFLCHYLTVLITITLKYSLKPVSFYFCLEHIALFLHFPFFSVFVSSHQINQLPSFSLDKLLSCSQSAWPEVLVASHIFEMVKATVFVLSGSEYLRMCQDSSVSQLGGSYSAPTCRLVRSQTSGSSQESMHSVPFQVESEGWASFLPLHCTQVSSHWQCTCSH